LLFNSYEFIFVFLPITFFVYFYLNHKRLTVAAKGFLVFTSLFFYSWWNIIYLPLILASILFNYIIGNSLNDNSQKIKLNKKVLLTFGIVANLLLLGYFKYADFFIENFNVVTNSNVNLLHLALPLAISFFTFQQVAYLVDSYRQETKEYDFLNYTVFVTFFPQLIAGPIVHHSEMMSQFAQTKNKIFNYKNIAAGIFIFTIGFFKKVVIADTFGAWATQGFDVVENLNMLSAWATSLSYTFQLYFDFSGYTDMAIGVALLFNIKLPTNFNSPYKATSIQDFWRRWHITLSRFLRDYIYVPLGGNRKGTLVTYRNLMATFILGGIWHGAGWTFVFWGFLHGMALVIHRVWNNLGFRLWGWLGWFVTFNFINIAWVFFRAKEWDDAIKVLSAMFTGKVELPAMLVNKLSFLTQYGVSFGTSLKDIGPNKEIILSTIAAFIIVAFLKNSNELAQKFKPNFMTLLVICLMFVYSIITFMTIKSEFLYFNF